MDDADGQLEEREKKKVGQDEESAVMENGVRGETEKWELSRKEGWEKRE